MSAVLATTVLKSNTLHNQRFRNPWPSFESLSFRTLLSSLHYQHPSPSPSLVLPTVVKPAFAACTIHQPQVMWLGHASVYLHLPKSDGEAMGILFDPIFSSR